MTEIELAAQDVSKLKAQHRRIANSLEDAECKAEALRQQLDENRAELGKAFAKLDSLL